MGKISVLSEETVSRISAGEVIERPSYAVKELVENSIDAKAKNIDIIIVDSGLTEITVIDDGIGMKGEDLKIALLPHTTSKIHTSEDLMNVSTLGFRGEGLSSLASIADVSLSSRTKGSEVGNIIISKDAVIQTMKQTGMAPGTRVSAYRLMHNLPARKKFLKSERTEFRHIAEYVSEVSLSFPNIRFSLTHNGKKILDIGGDVSSRLNEVLGETVSSSLLHNAFTNTITNIRLFLSHPENSLPSRNKLYIYVNNRPVSDNLISTAIKEAYGKLLDPHSYPIGAVFITIPSQFVDVNVHPTKREVRFEGSELVFQEVLGNTRELLSSYNLTFGAPPVRATSRAIASELKAEVEKLQISRVKQKITSEELIIIDNTYLVVAHPDGLILFDQHAAHEALLFEAFSKSFQKHKTESNALPQSILVELTKTQMLTFEEHSELFLKMGFQIEVFGGNTVKVSAIPKLVNENNISSHISEILDNVGSSDYPDIDHINNKMIAFLSCKSAIKAGDRLTNEEAFKIIRALEENDTIYTCPHGRPVKRIITVRELQKMFKRV